MFDQLKEIKLIFSTRIEQSVRASKSLSIKSRIFIEKAPKAHPLNLCGRKCKVSCRAIFNEIHYSGPFHYPNFLLRVYNRTNVKKMLLEHHNV